MIRRFDSQPNVVKPESNLPRQIAKPNIFFGKQKSEESNSDQSSDDEVDQGDNPFSKHLRVSKSPAPPLRANPSAPPSVTGTGKFGQPP